MQKRRQGQNKREWTKSSAVQLTCFLIILVYFGGYLLMSVSCQQCCWSSDTLKRLAENVCLDEVPVCEACSQMSPLKHCCVQMIPPPVCRRSRKEFRVSLNQNVVYWEFRCQQWRACTDHLLARVHLWWKSWLGSWAHFCFLYNRKHFHWLFNFIYRDVFSPQICV